MKWLLIKSTFPSPHHKNDWGALDKQLLFNITTVKVKPMFKGFNLYTQAKTRAIIKNVKCL
jgi:hypothetical protein